MAERRWRRVKDWVGADFEDSLVMVQVELGTYVGLNDTAAAIWEAIEQPATRDEVVAFVRARFDVAADQCDTAVAATLERFEKIGLAVVA